MARIKNDCKQKNAFNKKKIGPPEGSPKSCVRRIRRIRFLNDLVQLGRALFIAVTHSCGVGLNKLK
jgi:hypothetical protein